jgi:hypothetical protein
MSIHRRPGPSRRRARPSRSTCTHVSGNGQIGGSGLIAESAVLPRPRLDGIHRPAQGQDQGITHPSVGLIGVIERHWPVMLVVLAFVASWTIIPIFVKAPVGDDWVYSLSVEHLLEDGRLEILDLSVTTLVFQVLWGALFGLVFGDSFGAQRLSTVVIFLLSGIAFYSLLRTLGVTYGRSALGSAVYLFNPLSFVLAFSFMTDPHYLATMVISVAFYAAGLRSDHPNRKLILWGAFFAGCAFLVRQQGALIPFGVVVWLALTRQIWFNRRGLIRVLEVAAIPAVMLIVYYLWLVFVHGVPEQQDAFTSQIFEAGLGGTWLLLRRMTYFETVMAGFFVLPIALASIVGVVDIVRRRVFLRGDRVSRRVAALRLAAIGGWLLIVIFGAIVTVRDNYLMPYVSQFVGTSGLGPNDLFGGRPALLDDRSMADLRLWLTWLCVGSAILLGVATIGRIGSPATPQRGIAAMVLIVGLGQVAGVMPPSFHFRDWIISVDRYLLPLLPFAIALLLWSLRDIRLALPIGWIALAAVAAFSVVGTRDFLVFQQATWDYDRYVNYDLAVPLTRMNGGSSWDGYFLYEYGNANHIPQQTVGGPWWSNLFATATDSTYVVSGSPSAPSDGTYVQIDQREYSSWLMPDPVYLYLMQRQFIPVNQPAAQPIPPDVPPPPVYAHPIP